MSLVLGFIACYGSGPNKPSILCSVLAIECYIMAKSEMYNNHEP